MKTIRCKIEVEVDDLSSFGEVVLSREELTDLVLLRDSLPYKHPAIRRSTDGLSERDKERAWEALTKLLKPMMQ